jgi:hypothetical protein
MEDAMLYEELGARQQVNALEQHFLLLCHARHWLLLRLFFQSSAPLATLIENGARS